MSYARLLELEYYSFREVNYDSIHFTYCRIHNNYAYLIFDCNIEVLRKCLNSAATQVNCL